MKNNEIYKEIVKYSDEAIFVEQNALLVFANSKALELFEFESSDIGQISWRKFFPDDRYKKSVDSSSGDIAGSFYQKVQIKTKSGKFTSLIPECQDRLQQGVKWDLMR